MSIWNFLLLWVRQLTNEMTNAEHCAQLYFCWVFKQISSANKRDIFSKWRPLRDIFVLLLIFQKFMHYARGTQAESEEMIAQHFHNLLRIRVKRFWKCPSTISESRCQLTLSGLNQTNQTQLFQDLNKRGPYIFLKCKLFSIKKTLKAVCTSWWVTLKLRRTDTWFRNALNCKSCDEYSPIFLLLNSQMQPKHHGNG